MKVQHRQHAQGAVGDGFGFFLGGALLALIGFKGALLAMAAVLTLIWISSLILLKKDLGKAKAKPKFCDILSKSRAINILSAVRMFLFGARDVWFVVALPVYLSSVFGWDFWQVGGFLVAWVIGYGIVQSFAPNITGKKRGHVLDGRAAFLWALTLAGLPAAIALGMGTGLSKQVVLLGGLMVFGALFAVNSSLHSYLIVSYAKEDGVSLDVGFITCRTPWATDWHGALRLGVSGVWAGCVLVDIQRIRAGCSFDFNCIASSCV